MLHEGISDRADKSENPRGVAQEELRQWSVAQDVQYARDPCERGGRVSVKVNGDQLWTEFIIIIKIPPARHGPQCREGLEQWIVLPGIRARNGQLPTYINEVNNQVMAGEVEQVGWPLCVVAMKLPLVTDLHQDLYVLL